MRTAPSTPRATARARNLWGDRKVRYRGLAKNGAHSVLTAIGQACRAVSRETLSKTIHWAVEQATTLGRSQQRIVTYLELA